MTDRASVLIIDDHWVSASGLSSLVKSTFPEINVDICHSVADVNKWMPANQVRNLLILADFWLNDGTALTVLELFCEQKHQVKMIVLSGDDHPQLVPKLTVAGVWGFISKAALPDELLRMIESALSNNPSPLSHDAVGALLHADQQQTTLLKMNATELGLTSRQADILFHVLSGRTNKAIARKLNITEQTVKEHVSAILSNFKVSNRLELIQYFANLRMTVEYKNNI